MSWYGAMFGGYNVTVDPVGGTASGKDRYGNKTTFNPDGAKFETANGAKVEYSTDGSGSLTKGGTGVTRDGDGNMVGTFQKKVGKGTVTVRFDDLDKNWSGTVDVGPVK
ncbi:MAG: hypothetical protein JZU67_00510, partial [Burkholderiaceae bacterium]|nr:hypothetical protein [Burkholderiaceae bacterium]